MSGFFKCTVGSASRSSHFWSSLAPHASASAQEAVTEVTVVVANAMTERSRTRQRMVTVVLHLCKLDYECKEESLSVKLVWRWGKSLTAVCKHKKPNSENNFLVCLVICNTVFSSFFESVTTRNSTNSKNNKEK